MTCFICEKEKTTTVSIDSNVYYMLCVSWQEQFNRARCGLKEEA